MRGLRSSLQSQKTGFDLPLLFTVLILVVFGLIMVYDASAIQGLSDFKDSLYYIRQQLIWVALGIFSMLFCTQFDYRNFKKYSFFLMIISFLMLVGVFIPG